MEAKENKEHFTFIWEIKHFSMCDKLIGECIKSPIFAAESIGSSGWYLEFYPKGESEEDKEFVSLYLCKVEDMGFDGCNIDFNISFLKPNREILVSQEIEHFYDPHQELNYGYPNFIEIKKLSEELNHGPEDSLIVQCSMKARKPRNWHETTTKINYNRNSVDWTVSYPHSLDWLQTKHFSFSEESSVDITLTCPHDKIFINIRKTNEKPCFLKCKIILMSAKNFELTSKSASHFYTSSNDLWQFPNFITKSELNALKGEFMKDGSFTIMFEFLVSNGTESIVTTAYTYENSNEIYTPVDTEKYFINNLKTLFSSKKFADVELRIGNDIIPAHKCILTANSPVFSVMFNQNMSESQTGVIEINDVEVEIIEAFLKYLYSGTVEDLDCERAIKLLLAGNKYQVKSLEDFCSNYLVTILGIENSCDILYIADMIGHEFLKTVTLNFILCNASEILSSAMWPKWLKKNNKLGSEVLYKLSLQLIDNNMRRK